jgi:hypothetical protein
MRNHGSDPVWLVDEQLGAASRTYACIIATLSFRSSESVLQNENVAKKS